MGHPSLSRHQLIVSSLVWKGSLNCESCQHGKHVQASFPSQVNNKIESPFLLFTAIYGDQVVYLLLWDISTLSPLLMNILSVLRYFWKSTVLNYFLYWNPTNSVRQLKCSTVIMQKNISFLPFPPLDFSGYSISIHLSSYSPTKWNCKKETNTSKKHILEKVWKLYQILIICVHLLEWDCTQLFIFIHIHGYNKWFV